MPALPHRTLRQVVHRRVGPPHRPIHQPVRGQELPQEQGPGPVTEKPEPRQAGPERVSQEELPEETEPES